MSYSIIYQDNDLVLVHKPQGLATAPGKQENLCSKIFHDYPELSMVQGYHPAEGGLLNRLDNETGGIVFFAKNNSSFLYYSEQMKNETIDKYYTALVEGELSESGIISLPIAHHEKNSKKMVIADERKRYRSHPQKAETEYKLIEKQNSYSLIEILIRKGVRHQIRIHLKAIGHPIINDTLYGNIHDPKYQFHCLIAHKVVFNNLQGKKIEIQIPVKFI